MPNGLFPLVVLAAILRPVVGPAVAEDNDGASRAFARYLATVQRASTWSPETIEIDASLPKLRKQGHLRAIRRISASGDADYQVLEIAGDRTVRQQVIARYLSAQMTAAEIPASTVAITPANYEFRYKGIVMMGDTVAYAFQIKPLKKRLGLMSGELWIEPGTGAAIRQSGQLVKSPSIFVKRVDITRETELSEGIAQVLHTHLSVDTRLVGVADLNITESPMR